MASERLNGRTLLPLVAALISGSSVGCSGIHLEDLAAPKSVSADACVAIGFLGGRDRWDDATKGVRQMALRLRDPANEIYAETFENRRRDVALEYVIGALDQDRDGEIEAAEAARARIVIYGQSLGGSAVLKFARSLAALNVPVELTVQVDSVGRGDAEVPANVRYAANLYQDDGLLIEGEHPIWAIDPSRTQILGNWKFDYDRPPGADISLDSLPWWKIVFRVAHAKMDRDPRVWRTVDVLLRGACSGQDLEALAVDLGKQLGAPGKTGTQAETLAPRREILEPSVVA